MAGKFKYSSGDLVGKNKVKLIRYIEKNSNRQWKCEFECNTEGCNNTFIVALNSVSSGSSQYCQECNKKKAQERGKKIGTLSYYKDYTNKENPFYLFVKPLEYYDNKGIQYWDIQCKCCGKHYQERPTYVISSTRRRGNNPCDCWRTKRESKGSILLQGILDGAGITFEKEKYYNDCVSKKGNFLYFDFFLPKQNILIEYDGEQHFFDSFQRGEEIFKMYQENDKIKNQYCKNNNITLIRIPYTDYKKLNWTYLQTKGVKSE